MRLSSDCPDIVEKVNLLKNYYMVSGNKIYIKQVVAKLKGDEDEESFMRTINLLLLATIICPSTSDRVDWRFLYSLIDLDTMKRTDWAAFCLQFMLLEIAN